MTAEAGGQHGLISMAGRRFAQQRSLGCSYVMMCARRGPFIPAGTAGSIAVDGPAAEVYRISPEEPGESSTRWRVAGWCRPIEEAARPAILPATGTTIYRGDAFPGLKRFIADCGGGLIHRKVLIPKGLNSKPNARRMNKRWSSSPRVIRGSGRCNLRMLPTGHCM